MTIDQHHGSGTQILTDGMFPDVVVPWEQRTSCESLWNCQLPRVLFRPGLLVNTLETQVSPSLTPPIYLLKSELLLRCIWQVAMGGMSNHWVVEAIKSQNWFESRAPQVCMCVCVVYARRAHFCACPTACVCLCVFVSLVFVCACASCISPVVGLCGS